LLPPRESPNLTFDVISHPYLLVAEPEVPFV